MTHCAPSVNNNDAMHKVMAELSEELGHESHAQRRLQRTVRFTLHCVNNKKSTACAWRVDNETFSLQSSGTVFEFGSKHNV